MDLGIIKNLKLHYRHDLVVKRLKQIEDKVPLADVNILEAINIVAKVWQTKVKPETISNCFRKAGFSPFSAGALAENVAEVVDDNFENDFNDLMSRTSCDDEFESYVSIDNNVEAYGRMTDDDIYAEVAGESEAEADDDTENEEPVEDVSSKKPLKDEITNAVALLNKSLQMSTGSTNRMYNDLFDIEMHLINNY
jgi:DDE superfamily endonuclease